MISVIVPIYNAEKTLNRCIDSILNQTVKDVELILVNDGSNDNSLSICEKYGSDNVKIINKTNGGVSSARNAGIEEVTGDYISFVDADDMVMPNFLEKLLGMIQNQDADIAISGLKKKVEDDTLVYDTQYFNSEDFLNMLLFGQVSIGVCGILIKTDVIKKNGLRFSEGYKYSEDLHMLWRLVHFSNIIAYTKEKRYVYFDIAGSAMSKFNENREDSFILFENLYEFFKSNRPAFAEKFKKYGISKNYWSFFWQAAVKLPKEKYMELCKKYNIKKIFRNLIFYPIARISVSAAIGSISLSVFRLISIKYGRKYLH